MKFSELNIGDVFRLAPDAEREGFRSTYETEEGVDLLTLIVSLPLQIYEKTIPIEINFNSGVKEFNVALKDDFGYSYKVTQRNGVFYKECWYFDDSIEVVKLN